MVALIIIAITLFGIYMQVRNLLGISIPFDEQIENDRKLYY